MPLIRVLLALTGILFFASIGMGCSSTPIRPVAPAGGAFIARLPTLLLWTGPKPRADSKQTSGISYDVQVDSNASFSTPELSASAVVARSFSADGLQPGTYFWRVRLHNITGARWQSSTEDGQHASFTLLGLALGEKKDAEADEGPAFSDRETRQPEKLKDFRPDQEIARPTMISAHVQREKEYSPACAPIGEGVAVVSERIGNPDIFTLSIGTVAARQRTYTAATDLDPCWSPDGKDIVFASDRLGTYDLFLIDTSRKSKAKLQLTSGLGDERDPAYTSDGKKIIYSASGQHSGVFYLWELDRELNTHTQLVQGSSPTCSRETIAYVSMKSGQLAIWTVGLDGGDETILTANSDMDDFDPAFSLDGEFIAFASNRSGNTDIWIMRKDGSEAIQVTAHPLVDRAPSWGPGGFLYFMSDRGGVAAVWAMDVSELIR